MMRGIAAEHPFTDGNKRTALNTVALFHAMNGQYLDYGEEMLDTLQAFASGEDVDLDEVANQFEEAAVPAEEVDSVEVEAEVKLVQTAMEHCERVAEAAEQAETTGTQVTSSPP